MRTGVNIRNRVLRGQLGVRRPAFVHGAGVAMALAFALLAAPGHAETALENNASRGFSAERLARLSTAMEQAVEDGVMVGGLGLIALDDEVVFLEAWGQRDREAGLAMTPDTLFRIYSMSKPVVSVAVMMLHEEGQFFLDEPVARYLPQLAQLEVALSSADGGTTTESDGTRNLTRGQGDSRLEGATRKAAKQPTIRDLLRHTAGFSYGFFGETEVDNLYRKAGILRSERNLEEFVTRLGRQPLQYEPGTRWHYSVSVDVLGALIEVVSGQTLGEFLAERIFTPLGMDDTSFVVEEKKWPRLAQIYTPENTETPAPNSALVVAEPRVSRNYRSGATFQSGGGGLVSTASDYLRFSRMLLNGGALDGARLLSPKSVELMTRDHLADIEGGIGRPGVGFGLGFAVLLDPGAAGRLGSVGEYSWGGAAGTRFWIDPVERLIGIFMVQSIPHRTRLGDRFKVLTYQALE